MELYNEEILDLFDSTTSKGKTWYLYPFQYPLTYEVRIKLSRYVGTVPSPEVLVLDCKGTVLR
jgi:hypothetical protein